MRLRAAARLNCQNKAKPNLCASYVFDMFSVNFTPETPKKMDAEKLDGHKKVLGIIYIVTASLSLLIALFVRAVMSIIFSFAFDGASDEEQKIADFVMAITSLLPMVIIIFSSLPTMIAGIGLVTRQSWATMLALILGCLKLFAIPIGTAIGIYAIWIYTEDQKLKKTPATR
jgi:hypothetical protein